MDDDDLRRAVQPCMSLSTTRPRYSPGDALQTLAFDTLAQAPASADTRIALIRSLSEATGSLGMCGASSWI